MTAAAEKNLLQTNVVTGKSSELLAREIADSGAGLHPTSKIRDAIYTQALSTIRALRNSDPFHDGDGHG